MEVISRKFFMHDAYRFIWLSFFFLLSYGLVFAKDKSSICDATETRPCIVQDTKNPLTSIKWFRDIATISQVYHGNILGINKLHISASEQPSEKGWQDIALAIQQQLPSLDMQILVLDLRQEIHGYLNDIPITLMSSENWINLGKTNEQSKIDEENWIDTIKMNKKVKGVLSTQQYKDKEFANGMTMKVISMENEASVIAKFGFAYRRIYIPDHRAPSDTEVDALLTLFQNMPRNTWLHVHCRGGKGRTTTVLAMFDMLHNANTVSFTDIIARQASIAPFYDLFDLDRGHPIFSTFYEQRVDFLKHFYEFSRLSLDGYKGSWSQWKAERG